MIKKLSTLTLTFQVVLALAAASASAEPQYAYGHAGLGYAGAYPAAYAAPIAHAYAAAPVAVPAPYAGPAVAHSLGLPEAATYALPPVRTVAEAPIVHQVREEKSWCPAKKKRFLAAALGFIKLLIPKKCFRKEKRKIFLYAIFRSLSPSSSGDTRLPTKRPNI